jgi:ribonucleoside-diphosphate reductase alpha chain
MTGGWARSSSIAQGGRGAAIAAQPAIVSLGLQYGVPLEEYVDAFTHPVRAVGPGARQRSDQICDLHPDYVFRELAVSYLERFDLAHVDPTDGFDALGKGVEEGKPSAAS